MGRHERRMAVVSTGGLHRMAGTLFGDAHGAKVEGCLESSSVEGGALFFVFEIAIRFTEDSNRGFKTVAMKPTGTYWIHVPTGMYK